MFTFIESTAFSRFREFYLEDDEYRALQQHLMERPAAGDVIRGSGGVRKLRWRRSGSGKRGGLRIIYYVRYRRNEMWMLTLYAKARHGAVPAKLLRQLKEEMEDE